MFHENEFEFSTYNFELANVDMMRAKFEDYERECHSCLERKLPLVAYDCVMKCSHAFNLLDSRGAISQTERANYILRVRTIAKLCCESYLACMPSFSSTSEGDALSQEGHVEHAAGAHANSAEEHRPPKCWKTKAYTFSGRELG